MPNIDTTLAERGTRYGDFDTHAYITQNIKGAMVDSPNWHELNNAMREALEMIAHKIGRILNGDPYYHDSWHDIIGYTKLVADALLEKETNDTKLQQLQAQQARLKSEQERLTNSVVQRGVLNIQEDLFPTEGGCIGALTIGYPVSAFTAARRD